MHPMITALLRPEAYDHPVERIELLQTHISWILLTGPYAYKIKKPVDLGFVNFSTPERRRWFCQEELRLNRRLAPELYLGVVTIHGPAERARFHGDGEPIDVAVRMHQFPQQALLPAVLAQGGVTNAHWDDLADRLAAFHAAAARAPGELAPGELAPLERASLAGVGAEAPATAGALGTEPFGSPAAVRRPAEANLDVLEVCEGLERCVLADGTPAMDVLPALRRWTAAEYEHLQAFFAERLAAGWIRECHGDLHLGNMLLHRGRIEVFDCLEFSPSLRWIDGISEMAFLGMDLQQRGRPVAAARVLNRWLEHGGDYPGMVAWRWYLVYRALVRAKVTALRLGQGDLSAVEAAALLAQLSAYLGLARASCRPDPGVLLITHGVSGSGKSHLARHLCGRFGWIHLRSDLERKRWFGCWGASARTSLGGDPYRREVTDLLYGERLPACAEAVLSAGFSVVVDATFLLREQRDRMRAVAVRSGARFVILECVCPEDLAARRIESRRRQGNDPSDADVAVLRHQLQARDPLTQPERAAAVVLDAVAFASPAETGQGGEECLATALAACLGLPFPPSSLPSEEPPGSGSPKGKI